MRIKDILEAIQRIESYTSGITFEQYQNDPMRVDATIRNLEIIGEAASRIPVHLQETYADLPWLEMRGMRNIMAHEYFGVSIPIIWQTIQRDLKPLADGMKRILEEAE